MRPRHATDVVRVKMRNNHHRSSGKQQQSWKCDVSHSEEIFTKIPYLKLSANPFRVAFVMFVVFVCICPHGACGSTRHRRHWPKRYGDGFSKTPESDWDSRRRPRTSREVTGFENFGGFSKSIPASSFLPPCSHVGDETNEISARSYMAETVFEGKARSRSSIRDPGGKYGVTFVVQRVHKDTGQNALKPRAQVRLYFKQKLLGNARPSVKAHCVQKYNYTKRQDPTTKANIKRGRRYIIFVNGIGPHNYTVLGEPVPKTKKNRQAVRNVLCRHCVKPINVTGLENKSAKIGEQMQLICRMDGNPLPALQWFKDGSPILVNAMLKIQFKKKRSLLVIPQFQIGDAGRYECRGLGVQSLKTVSIFAKVSVWTVPQPTRIYNYTELLPFQGSSCSVNDSYCLNGGTCIFYDTIQEPICQCAEGYNGGRCENKDVINPVNSTYEPITCFDGVTPSYPCVTVHKPLKKIDFFV